MILAKNIHKFFDNNHILKGIDININKVSLIFLFFLLITNFIQPIFLSFKIIFNNLLAKVVTKHG